MRGWIHILLLILGCLPGLAEFRGPEFHFKHINTENGLPSNRVRDIVQDEDGFMWFATDGGLVRYDGYMIKNFVPEPSPKNQEEVFVMSLLPYKRGLIVGTDHGLYGYDPAKENLGKLPLNFSQDVKGRIEGVVRSIVADSDETLWIAVENEGIYEVTKEGLVTANYRFPEVDDRIASIYLDEDNTLWALVNSEEDYLYKYDRRDSKFKKFSIRIAGDKAVTGGNAMIQDSYGEYWLGSWENGLIRFNGRTGEGEYYCSGPNPPSWHIHSITQYSPEQLLIGSDGGLMLFDIPTGDYCTYFDDELTSDSMQGRFVYPITKDSDGGIWIGTFYRGINYMPKEASRFNNWHHSRFKNSVSGNIVSRLCEDKDGNIWIGSADGGLCRYNPKTQLFTHYPLSGNMETDNVNSLCADGDRLWVGTYANGVGWLDIHSGKWQKVPVENDPNPSCYAIYRDLAGNVWMGATQTLALYNAQKNIFEKISDLKAWINEIVEDENGELWIATQGAGLFRYNPVSKRWKNYGSNAKAGSLPHNHINSVKVLNGNQVLVATPKGLCQYDDIQDSFQPYEGYPQGINTYSVEKSGKDLWVSTNNGLVLLQPEGFIRTYTTSDGLDDNQYLPGSSWKASDGILYFGSVSGFSSVDPEAVKVKSAPPQIRFTGLNLINTPEDVGDEHLPKSLNALDRLELDNSDHTFTIYFAALNYSNPGKNKYRYKLEGFDKSWHDSPKDNSATYSNLPPGTYTFRVLAANSDDVWNDEGISLKIVVKPVWYMTTLMKLLYVFLGLALLLLIVRFVLWKFEQNHNRELERISDNKEKEMFRSKFNFFTVVAHEIRTPVSLIIGPLEKVLGSGEKFSPPVKEDLHIIDRNARRLLTLVNQLLDYKKVEDNALPVGFRHEKIVPQIKSIIERFMPSLQQKGISLHTEFPDPEMEVDVDPEAITKLVSNLINNARKFTKDSITVKCAPLDDTGRFEIMVKDNGIGIDKENRDKVFRPFFQVLDNINEAKGGTGLGLSIVKSVVDAHGGEIKLESEPGHGSTFTAILPMHQENVVAMPAQDELDAIKDEDISPDDEEVSNHEDPVLLVVDDNKEMVKFISSHFEKNYEVVTASNGKEALERMAEKPVSLIICDWMMPVMDGEEFLRKIRHDENYSHIPFVMLTAKTDNASKVITMKSGADAYVEKPFSISYLDARIANLLDMRALLRRKYSKMPLEPITTIAQTEVDNELLKKLQALIEENFSNPNLNVDFIAEHLGISRSGLYAKIRSLADVTPNELIQITRLKKAAELLSENHYRVNEICYMVGFNSSSYFSRCFQKQFGMKPGEFASKK